MEKQTLILAGSGEQPFFVLHGIYQQLLAHFRNVSLLTIVYNFPHGKLYLCSIQQSEGRSFIKCSHKQRGTHSLLLTLSMSPEALVTTPHLFSSTEAFVPCQSCAAELNWSGEREGESVE